MEKLSILEKCENLQASDSAGCVVAALITQICKLTFLVNEIIQFAAASNPLSLSVINVTLPEANSMPSFAAFI